MGLSGSEVPAADACIPMDLDGDGDVDGIDATLFQPCMSGENNAPPADCSVRAAIVDGRFGMRGLIFDVITGQNASGANVTKLLLFARARHYAPDLGRWLQRDPLGYVDGPNLYEAFGGNPLANLHPTGLKGNWLWELLFGRARSTTPSMADACDHANREMEIAVAEAMERMARRDPPFIFQSCGLTRLRVQVPIVRNGETIGSAFVPYEEYKTLVDEARERERLARMPDHACLAKDATATTFEVSALGAPIGVVMTVDHAVFDHLKNGDVQGGLNRLLFAPLALVGRGSAFADRGFSLYAQLDVSSEKLLGSPAAGTMTSASGTFSGVAGVTRLNPVHDTKTPWYRYLSPKYEPEILLARTEGAKLHELRHMDDFRKHPQIAYLASKADRAGLNSVAGIANGLFPGSGYARYWLESRAYRAEERYSPLTPLLSFDTFERKLSLVRDSVYTVGAGGAVIYVYGFQDDR